MVEPLTAVHRNAVVAGKPFFTSRFDELFALSKEEFFEINGCGTFFLFWGKFYKFADFLTTFYCCKEFCFRVYWLQEGGARNADASIFDR